MVEITFLTTEGWISSKPADLFDSNSLTKLTISLGSVDWAQADITTSHDI